MFASFLRVRTRIILLKNLNVLSQNLEEVEGSHIETDKEKGQIKDTGQERGLLVQRR